MVILVTDDMTSLEWGRQVEAERFGARLNKLEYNNLATTIISDEEQLAAG